MNINDFTISELTAAINKVPRQWGRVGELGVFKDRGTRSQNITVEDTNGTLGLLMSHAFGAEGSQAQADIRNTYSFSIPQTVHDDLILPSDLMSVRGFGTEGLATMANEVALRLQRMRSKHDITLEHKRINAIKGRVMNGDNTSVIVDLFSTFGITQTTVSFALNTSTTNVEDKVAEVLNNIEDNLMGDTMTGVRVLCSPEFFSALVNHAKIKEVRMYNDNQSRLMGTNIRNGFTVGGVTFEEYRGAVNGVRFIAANEAYAFPEGTNDTFVTYFAPADFNETVNTMGQAFYAKQWEKEGGRGVVLHTQCNSLPLCHQPKVLIKLTA